jgi:hypothetical protein
MNPHAHGTNQPGNEITITGLARNASAWTNLTNVAIPSVIDGIPVVTIGSGAFTQNTDISHVGGALGELAHIRHVTIPSSVRKIESRAFEGLNQLMTVTFHEGLREIEDHAFNSCFNLAPIQIPSTVTTIGTRAFSYAFNQHFGDVYIIIPRTVTTMGRNVFEGSGVSPTHARLFVEHTTIPTGWNTNWNEAAGSTLQNPRHLPFVQDVLTATYFGQNGQFARHVIENQVERRPVPQPAPVGEGRLQVPNLEELEFTYDNERYVLHGWASSTEADAPLLGFGGALIEDIDDSISFHARLETKTDLNRRVPLTNLYNSVTVFINRHRENPLSDGFWDKLWNEDSWFHLVEMWEEARPYVVYDHEYKHDLDINTAYRNLFNARISLAPLPVDDSEAVERGLKEQLDLLILLVAHSSAMAGERESFPVDKWIWTEFELALDIAKEFLEEVWEGLPFGANEFNPATSPIELLNWRQMHPLDPTPSQLLAEAEFTSEDINGVFVPLVEALQSIIVRHRVRVDILIWLGAVFIIVSLIGIALAIDMTRGRGTVVKVEKPWTTYGAGR